MSLALMLLACSTDLPDERVAITRQPVDPGLADVAHGRHLVEDVLNCGECHGAGLAGGTVADGFPVGRLVAPNLTRLDYTREDWVGALHHGVTPEGRKLLLMPSDDYAQLDQTDLASVVAYLETLEPAGSDLGPSHLGPMGQFLVHEGEWSFAADRIDHAAAIPVATPAGRGPYLVRVASCLTCHGGGPGMSFGPGETPSANLTPHPEGLAAWTEADFLRAMTTGVRPDGTALDRSMPWRVYARWPEEDLKAVWAVLRALPPQPDPGR